MFGVVLREKESNDGLDRNDVIDLFDLLNENGGYPIEILANALEFDYEKSGLNDFIAGILDDMEKESEDYRYEFKGIEIWLSR